MNVACWKSLSAEISFSEIFPFVSGIQDLRFPAYKVKPAYLRVYNDSMLKYSARVNYDVACPMHFEKYPVDIQRCNISFESWGHTNHYIVLSWLQEKRKFSSSIALAQFDLDLHFIEEPPSAFGALGKNTQWSITLLQFVKNLIFGKIHLKKMNHVLHQHLHIFSSSSFHLILGYVCFWIRVGSTIMMQIFDRYLLCHHNYAENCIVGPNHPKWKIQ